jgi:hypothetical protein
MLENLQIDKLWQLLEQVRKITKRVQPVFLRRLDGAVDHCAGFNSEP